MTKTNRGDNFTTLERGSITLGNVCAALWSMFYTVGDIISTFVVGLTTLHVTASSLSIVSNLVYELSYFLSIVLIRVFYPM